ncbi:fimbrial protein [Type-D symbiont of Plautia stali]|uniref:fimbrial protein n=1 Tax=Type-D symbiont of Plautia stali TaxID=1560356 RepID=UPI00073E9513|nr:fimbrial protein [Type-D symbiont of Plautia stali]
MKCIRMLITLFISFICSYSKLTEAKCNYASGLTSEVVKNISFGTVRVQRDTPIGTVLATQVTGSFQGGSTLAGCDVSWRNQWITDFTTLSGVGDRIYSTNIAGIGIRLTNVPASNRLLPYETGFGANAYVIIPGEGIKAELIKTAASGVGSGSIRTGTLARAAVKDNFYYARVDLTGTNNIVPVACSVISTSINVSMGNVLNTAFSGIGSTVATRNFNIPLDCDIQTRVNITLDATRDSSGAAGVIALNPSPSGITASGVGVQLLYKNSPVSFGEIITIGSVGTAGTYNVPLTARYYQTTNPVVAGQANATATFTMTYN